MHAVGGLSPLARGNPEFPHRVATPLGPIPARAGQPGSGPACRAARRAYPRSRVATDAALLARALCKGLSPLARGNLFKGLAPVALPGPIPARAGQPWSGSCPSCWTWAYPRSRGATVMRRAVPVKLMGLSPLARGNLRNLHIAIDDPGPIPARAGQPFGCAAPALAFRAYPRSRGATSRT